MNGPTATPTTQSAAPTREELVREIDSSCATPLMLMFVKALGWLVISSVFALIASVKLHSPAILADSAWLAYGRLLPAARDAFVYGFASQAGLAAALWILCRLGRTRLAGSFAVTIATLFWNLGVFLGTFGILRGDTTGFELLEFPMYGSAIFFVSYLIIAVCALLTFSARREGELYVSQWYILAALFSFAWLFTAARLLLVWHPVRGAMQIVVNGWFAHGVLVLWLSALALAVLFYFIPKLSGVPLFSRALAVLAFWSFVVFGAWGGLYAGLPVPSWIVSASVGGTAVLLVPLITNVINLWRTAAESREGTPLLGFFKTSLVVMAVAGALHLGMVLCGYPIRLTLFADGLEVLIHYGFFGFALFGAIHYIAPLLSGESASERLLKINCWGTLLGAGFYAAALVFGGIVQGRKLADGAIPFVDVMNATKPFLRASTLGLLLLVIGNVAIFCNVLSLARRCCARCCCPGGRFGRADLKPAEAPR